MSKQKEIFETKVDELVKVMDIFEKDEVMPKEEMEQYVIRTVIQKIKPTGDNTDVFDGKDPN